MGRRRYLSFCRETNSIPLPLSEYQVGLFMAHLVDDSLQHSSVKGYLSAVQRMQIVYSLGDPFVVSWLMLECKGDEDQTGKEVSYPHPASSSCYPCHLEVAVSIVVGWV